MMLTPRARKVQRYVAALDADDQGAIVPDAHRSAVRRCIEQGHDLDTADYIAMLHHLTQHAPGDFALRFGTARRLMDMGIVGHAIMSCETLRQALTIWSNFSGLAGDPFKYRATITGGIWTNDVFPAAVMPPAVLRFHAEEWIASFCRFAFDTTGASCADATIHFRHTPVPGVDYSALLPAAPRFRARHNRIALPATHLDAPILSHDDEMLDLLMGHFARHPPGGEPAGVVAQLRQLFFASAGRPPRLAEAAERLGFSARTLNRRLADEGTTYAQVLADYRSEHAQALVREGTLGTKQVAHAIGYRSHQSLRRAFAGWTGQPVGRWRAAARARP